MEEEKSFHPLSTSDKTRGSVGGSSRQPYSSLHIASSYLSSLEILTYGMEEGDVRGKIKEKRRMVSFSRWTGKIKNWLIF